MTFPLGSVRVRSCCKACGSPRATTEAAALRRVGGLLLAGIAVGLTAACSGAEPATWILPEATELDASTQTFDIAVTRIECASGVTGEVLPLEIAEGEVQVVITATVARNRGGNATCQGNDEVIVAVALEEPLGDRELVDGVCERHPDRATHAYCLDPVRWPR